jgi:hypothetical protein
MGCVRQVDSHLGGRQKADHRGHRGTEKSQRNELRNVVSVALVWFAIQVIRSCAEGWTVSGTMGEDCYSW